ncbi:MAG: hypothetical protein ACI80V_002184 [Rhodothermales bacterium]|jgi:hypothetical protein
MRRLHLARIRIGLSDPTADSLVGGLELANQLRDRTA